MKLEEAVKEYLLDLKDRKKSEETIYSWEKKLQRFVDFARRKGVENVVDIDPSHIKSFMRWRSETCQPKSVNLELRMLNAMFNYIIRFFRGKVIKENPADTHIVGRLDEEEKPMQAFSKEDIKKLLNLYNGNSYYDVRNKTIFMLLIETGIRISDVMNLESHNVFEECIKIEKGKGKKTRFVAVSHKLRKQLNQYERARKAFMGDDNCSYYFVSKTKKQLKKGSLQHVEKAIHDVVNIEGCFHNFRRFYGQDMYKRTNNIFAVSKLLGHSKVNVTQIYLNSIEDTEILKVGMDSPLSNM